MAEGMRLDRCGWSFSVRGAKGEQSRLLYDELQEFRRLDYSTRQLGHVFRNICRTD
jgi:hypothetical protein